MKREAKRRPKKPRTEVVVVQISYKDKLRYPKIERHGVYVDRDGCVNVQIQIDPITVDTVTVFPERRPLKDVKGLLRDAKRIANGDL